MASSSTSRIYPRSAPSSSNTALRTYFDLLPPTARTLYRLLGDITALNNIVRAFGGVTLHIPARWHLMKKHALCPLLTDEQMRTLHNYYKGTEFYMPRCTRALLQTRNAMMIQKFSTLAAKGQSSGRIVQALALEFAMTDRRVWSILKTVA